MKFGIRTVLCALFGGAAFPYGVGQSLANGGLAASTIVICSSFLLGVLVHDVVKAAKPVKETA